MADLITSSTLRVLNVEGKTIGTAFIVATNLAITCAHVARDANALAGDRLQVQLTGQVENINALVLPNFWRDVEAGDVAFLELEKVPDNTIPLRLGPAEHSQVGNTFRSFGYATAADLQGIFANGSIDGYLKEYKLIQLQSPQANHGISGAPVFDEKRGVVVGMITKGHTELGRNQETTFATATELLFEVCPEIRPSENCPYLGLETFTDKTSQFFFGRETLTQKLLDALRGGNRFLAVFGPSGSGKSSVIRAGLLPALNKDQLPGSSKWAQITMRPADNPFEQMKAAGFDSMDLNVYLQSHDNVERILLFVDQFEELFTLRPDDLRQRFVLDIATALENSKFMLVLSMRDDFYSAFQSKATPLAKSEHLKIENVPGVLTQDELVAMIKGPTEPTGLALEEGLPELIIQDLTSDDQVLTSTLPLLESALTQLWIKRRDGFLLTHEAYHIIGGVTGSVASWADEAYSNLSKTDQVLAEGLLTSLVYVGDEKQGLPDTRRRRKLTEFGTTESIQRVIKHFTDCRLIITSKESIELVHETLLHKWDRLRIWIDKNRSDLLEHRRLIDAANSWEQHGQNSSYLDQGARLSQALLWANAHTSEMSTLEAEYLKACLVKQRKDRQAVQIRWASIIGAIVFTLVVGVLAWKPDLIIRPLPPQWVVIPAGEFRMGSNAEDLEIVPKLPTDNGPDDFYLLDNETALDNETKKKVDLKVFLDDYKISVYETTNKQYYRCVKARVCSPPNNTTHANRTSESEPVTDVSWEQARQFCEWNGALLPTEAQWEKAARGNPGQDSRIFPWGNDLPDPKNRHLFANVVGRNKGGAPMSVYSFPKGNSAYGVADMAGNVWEWVRDWYSPHYYQDLFNSNPNGPVYNPQGPLFAQVDQDPTIPIKTHTLRGGAFDNDWVQARSSYRSSELGPGATSPDVGFRCVIENPVK